MKLSYESPSYCVAVGWPWHGPIKKESNQYNVILPNDRRVPIKDFGSVDTLLWDIGRPDIESEAIAEAGGAWWGKAILRYPCARYEDRASYQAFCYGTDRLKKNGVPLYRAPFDREPGRVFICEALIQYGILQISAQYGGGVISSSVDITPAQIGQGAGQPEFAAGHGSMSTAYSYSMITDAEPGRYFSAILDAKGCKILLGIIGYTSSSNTVSVTPPPATANGGPATYAALVELELTANFFATGGVSGAIIRLIEDRSVALGNPALSTSDETVGSLRTQINTWVQTDFLVTAWYAADGSVVTVRGSRTQESKHTREIRSDGGAVVEEQTAQRKTTISMTRAGIQFDEVVLLERLQVAQRDGTSLRVIRTVQLTDDPDDVADSGVITTTNVSWPELPAVYGPGLHRVATSVAYIYKPSGSAENLIREQDLRAVWACALSNKLGGICTAVEPYDYEPGAESYTANLHYRPAAHPQGIDNRRLRAQESHLGIGSSRFTRSFYYFNAGATGSYNPVTAQVLRGNALNRESWV